MTQSLSKGGTPNIKNGATMGPQEGPRNLKNMFTITRISYNQVLCYWGKVLYEICAIERCVFHCTILSGFQRMKHDKPVSKLRPGSLLCSTLPRAGPQRSTSFTCSLLHLPEMSLKGNIWPHGINLAP